MCIICYKPENVALPSKAILENCFWNNPDGAGLAIMRPENDAVEIHKGFMTFADFYDFAKASVRPIDTCGYHFRIATSGGITPENCHPFPVSRNVNDLQALSINSRFAVIHNGVLGKGSKDLSDTQLYIRDTLSKRNLVSLPDSTIHAIEQETTGNRLLLFDGKEHIAKRTGTWIDDKTSGLSFSNSSYSSAYGYGTDIDYDSNFICPHCGSTDCYLISETHFLIECYDCTSVFHADGKILIPGDSYTWFNSIQETDRG